MKKAKGLLISVMLLSMVTGCFLGEKAGNITGKALTWDGQGISGITVSTSSGKITTTTTSNGSYTLENIADPMSYTVTAYRSSSDYKTISVIVEPSGGFSCNPIGATDQNITFDRPADWYKVEYKVTGTTSSVSLTYSDSNEGTAQESDVAIPWTYTFNAKVDHFLYISAQNQEDSGSVTTTIYTHGSVFKTTTSTGAYVIATSSGTFE